MIKTQDIIKSIVSVMACVVSSGMLWSCSDDFSSERVAAVSPADSFTVELSVPDVKVIGTRAGEDETTVYEVILFLFDTNGQLLESHPLESSKITDISTETSIKKSLGTVLSEDTKSAMKTLYVITNGNSLQIAGGKTMDEFTGSLADLEATIAALPASGLNVPLIMSGKTELASSQNKAEVTVNRLAAKVTVTQNEGLSGYTLKGFTIYNTASGAYLKDPTDGFSFYDTNLKEQTVASSVGLLSPVYVYPSEGADTVNTTKAFVVLKAETGSGAECYYRINFRQEGTPDKNGTSAYTKLDLEPNHWYKIEIEEILTDGYPTPEEATKHPEMAGNDIKYRIHDHSANVFSMVTDGIRELGVTAEVEYIDQIEENNPNCFTVRWFSIIDGEESTAPTFEITEGSDWIEITKQSGSDQYLSEDDTAVSGFGAENANPGGTVKKYWLSKKGEGTDATIKVTWQGLSREIKVVNHHTGDYMSMCRVSLTIKKGDTEVAKIADYWKFISGDNSDVEFKDGSSTLRSIKLFGVDDEAMGESKRRDKGFHFPMPYGESSEYTYEYTVMGPEGETLGGITPHFTYSKCDDVITQNMSCTGGTWGGPNQNNQSITLTFNSSNAGYTYGVGEVYIIINHQGGAEYLYFPVYHTGFFHFDESSSDADDKGFFYYEVVPMGQDSKGNNLYWLDRNMGAKSNMMFVDAGDDLIGNEDARGRYYSIASQSKYVDPIVHDDRVCPPGYHVPTTTEWDAIRLGSRFHTESTTEGGKSFIATYYDTGNSAIGNVYFPKTLFYNLAYSNPENGGNQYETSPNSGINRCGYYWTRSASPAMEKEQLGNWLRSLLIQGHSTSFNNSSVSDHKMALRCVAGREAEQVTQTPISFNVHGATHVYLFNRYTGTPINTFPGKPVGTVQAAEKWLSFYTTTNLSESELLMFFTRINSDGTVTFFCKDESGNNFDDTKNLSEVELTEQYAWEVNRGWYYDFCAEANKRDSNVTEKKQDAEEQPKWTQFTSGDKITFHWRADYEGVSHTIFTLGDRNWSNQLPDWNMPSEDEGNGFRKYTVDALHISTDLLWVNVKDQNEGNIIRYQINFDDKKVNYHKDTGDQEVRDSESLNIGCYISDPVYDPEYLRYIYDIYLYSVDSSKPVNFPAGSNITFHWPDRYNDDNNNEVMHPNIYMWSNVDGFSFKEWPGEAGTDLGNNLRTYTISSLNVSTTYFGVLVFQQNDDPTTENSTKMKFNVNNYTGDIRINNAQHEEDSYGNHNHEDVSNVPDGRSEVRFDKDENRYYFDFYLTEPK